MATRQHTLGQKLLCAFLCLLLAFGFSFPHVFAYGDEPKAIEHAATSSDNGEIANSSETAGNFQGSSEGEDPETEGTNPENPTDPSAPDEPDPPVVGGPITFDFNISSTPQIDIIEQVSSGLMITWTPVSGVDGYIVLRRLEGAGFAFDETYEAGLSKHSITLDSKLFKQSAINKLGWSAMVSTTSPRTVSWVDKKTNYGQMYEYCVIAYKKNGYTSNNYIGLPYIPIYAKNRDISKPSSTDIGYRMKSPDILYASKNGKTLTLQWSKVTGADGYIVECSTNSAFTSKKRKVIVGRSNLSTRITGLLKNSNYCIRIRAYGNVFSGTQYSMWTGSYFTNAQKRASMTRLTYKYKVKVKEKKKDTNTKTNVLSATTMNLKNTKSKKKVRYVTKTKTLELRGCANQKMGKYDTMQGGCSDGRYMYFVLLNKLANRCKIVKVGLSTKKVVKVSKPLKLNHGNGLAYNPTTKRLVVVHGEGSRRTISEVNKSTLKIVAKHTVNAPNTLQGATASQLNAYSGFGSIAYSSKEDVYVCLLYKSHNIVLLDSDFKMIKYIPLSHKKGQVYQCVEVAGDSILIGESFGTTKAKSYNILSTYNWDGEYVTTTRLQKSYELENVFVAGTKVYAGFYRYYIKGGKALKDNYVYRVNTF